LLETAFGNRLRVAAREQTTARAKRTVRAKDRCAFTSRLIPDQVFKPSSQPLVLDMLSRSSFIALLPELIRKGSKRWLKQSLSFWDDLGQASPSCSAGADQFRTCHFVILREESCVDVVPD
jgi:hypothetical protein